MFLERFKGAANTGDIDTKYNKYVTAAFIIGFTVTLAVVVFMLMYWVL